MVFSCTANTIDVVLRNEKDIAQCKQFFFMPTKKEKRVVNDMPFERLLALTYLALGFRFRLLLARR